MASRLNPYLSFRDTAREAMDFYQEVFGGEVSRMTFAEFGMTEGGIGEQIMHSQLETPDGYIIMAADTPPQMEHSVGGSVTVALTGDDSELLHGYWDRLSEGATVVTPLEAQVWGDAYGMCIDRFGTPWMINIAGPGGASEPSEAPQQG
ncbi:MAG: VOC family protein [Actinomycetales bacterium]|nr:VOC family protein [Actinomycetales bacterium]